MEKYESIQSLEQQQNNMRIFTCWVVAAQILGLLAVIMMAVWLGHYQDGFAWQEDPDREFNYHPLFMMIGLIFLYGDAILVYRVFRNDKKIYIKILHGMLHMFALIFAGVGLKAVFDSHNLKTPPSTNLFTLHSWLGLTTVLLFGLQWLCGLVTFLFPGLKMEFRAFYKPLHVYWGLAIFFMAIATALIGINEREIWHNKDYNKKNGEGLLCNWMGLVLVVLALVVGYVVTNPKYSRQPTPDEEQIQLTQ